MGKIVIAVLFSLPLLGCASVPTPRHYVCASTPTGVSIDGRLSESAWERASWTDYFVDIEGDKKPPPRMRTRAKLLWDAEYLYIGAELEEPHVWGTLKERDEIVFHDNDFEVFIDPDGDAAQYYEIEVNALNTIFDLFLVRTYRAGGPALHDWNMSGLKTAVHVNGTLNDPGDTDAGWTVELALPWKSLAPAAGTPAPPKSGDTWRVNFSRVEWQHRVVDGRYEKVPDTPENNWVWSPQGVIDMHRPERWGYVEFRAVSASERSAQRDGSVTDFPTRCADRSLAVAARISLAGARGPEGSTSLPK